MTEQEHLTLSSVGLGQETEEKKCPRGTKETSHGRGKRGLQESESKEIVLSTRQEEEFAGSHSIYKVAKLEITQTLNNRGRIIIEYCKVV